jgi:hypothetical protein
MHVQVDHPFERTATPVGGFGPKSTWPRPVVCRPTRRS